MDLLTADLAMSALAASAIALAGSVGKLAIDYWQSKREFVGSDRAPMHEAASILAEIERLEAEAKKRLIRTKVLSEQIRLLGQLHEAMREVQDAGVIDPPDSPVQENKL